MIVLLVSSKLFKVTIQLSGIISEILQKQSTEVTFAQI